MQEYCGDVINFKSYSKSYKMKKRIENPEENRAIFLNIYETIIDRQTLEKVQALQKGMHSKKPTVIQEPSVFSGLPKCPGCGGNRCDHHYKAHGRRADRPHRGVPRRKTGWHYQPVCRDLLQLHRRFRCVGSPEDSGGRHYHGNEKRRSTQLRPGTGCGMNFSKNKKAECSYGIFRSYKNTLHGPSGESRTHGLLNPIQARYQTALHPDATVIPIGNIYYYRAKAKNVNCFF